MFRNPRENSSIPHSLRAQPSVGRPPSPPRSVVNPADTGTMTTTARRAPSTKAKATPSKSRHIQTTLVPSDFGKKTPNNGSKLKPKATPNGNILTFFKKAEELNNRIFLQERGVNGARDDGGPGDEDIGWFEGKDDGIITGNNEAEERYNENGGSNKRRRISDDIAIKACSPPPPDPEPDVVAELPPSTMMRDLKKKGPFLDESDSEDEDAPVSSTSIRISLSGAQSPTSEPFIPTPAQGQGELDAVDKTDPITKPDPAGNTGSVETFPLAPKLKTEETSVMEDQDFDDFESMEDEELPEGEEYDERRWMEEQRKLEMEEAGFEGSLEATDAPLLFPGDEPDKEAVPESSGEAPTCPICSVQMKGLSEQEIGLHVNACLDGTPLPLPTRDGTTAASSTSSKMFKKEPRPAKAAQASPFAMGLPNGASSAFSKITANHTEDAAWATAAAAERSARGKPAFQRTCPFYKILPGFYICVDAFRYGAVKGQNAYFLSHFHSDHYIGLTSSWSHGPIYCSKVTGNLVRQQLRVDPKWVVDLDFEEKTEVPGTEGVFVTMISANHCPGSSLFLFEKEIGKGKNPRLQRVLHCGDFRACQAHLEHPLLRPDVADAVTGKNRQQKLDVCYLDTTYLNPKYAFPPQQQVIQACADMCVSLNNSQPDANDPWETMKRDRAGQKMTNFIQKPTDPNSPTATSKASKRGRLLVVVGTYSIGKERICIGIAQALGSKIFAPPAKQKICRALEDPELASLLTSDPREAQVHMTPLFEIRADTLADYLTTYGDHFSRCVGFRPSGWNYRPPGSRFVDSPTVHNVLYSKAWKSTFAMKDLTPQRGSSDTAMCFGVPYSEHSSFRELTMFCCALRIDKIVPTVNVGNAKSREKMKMWCERWAVEKRKAGLFKLGAGGAEW
ncbi:DRMBL-domain-containing protein [Sporormia fimetaria CBS 119925]|uniref:DRMBL-domain-containing protein n=1 Tax=Sporormia fimetaria CBS 119925 TaxID=1340428 RepID=A0A6A6VJZ7_9PLEO|nr:DRMBL-domain-containing protein [Sporormia fimetaria CBS 119925]